MGPKLRGAPPGGDSEIQKFMREMQERDEDRAVALKARDQAVAAAVLVREQAAAALLAGVQAAHAAELAVLQGQLNALANGGGAAAAAGDAPHPGADGAAGGDDEPEVEGLGGAAGSDAATVYSPAGMSAKRRTTGVAARVMRKPAMKTGANTFNISTASTKTVCAGTTAGESASNFGSSS